MINLMLGIITAVIQLSLVVGVALKYLPKETLLLAILLGIPVLYFSLTENRR